MSVQNLCMPIRNSWIPPARAISSPGSVALLKAPEYTACPEESMKFRGLRKRPSKTGACDWRGRTETDSTPKMLSQAQVLTNLTHYAAEQKEENVSSNSAGPSKLLATASSSSWQPHSLRLVLSYIPALPTAGLPLLFQDLSSLQETWSYFYSPLQGAVISRHLTDLEPHVFYPTLPSSP